MDSRDGMTLVLAAVTPEVGPLVRRLGLRKVRGDGLIYAAGGVLDGTGEKIGGGVVAVTGMGGERACDVAEQVYRRVGEQHAAERGEVKRVVVMGFAGGLDPALGLGDVVEPGVVVDASTGRTYEPPDADRGDGTLVSCDRPIGSVAEKARLRDRFAAAAVDMETAALAAWCEQRGLSWRCVRAITDTAEQALPADSAALMRPSGEPDTWAAVRYVARRPWRVGELMRLGRGARLAAEGLARRVGERVERA